MTTDIKTRSAAMRARARVIREAGGIDAAIATRRLPKLIETTLSEALVLGLLRQGVRKYLAIFGHGSTDLGEVLRVYDAEAVTRTCNFRNEVEMAHAATALRWQYGETPAVVTSIGPGAMQALAGSLAAASNGVGVYHIYGDETTFGEGYNMQQVPKAEQGLFGQMTAIIGRSYVLHTPQAIRDALRRGATTVHHPYRAGPFFLLLPLNTQPAPLTLNLASLPGRPELPAMAPAGDEEIVAAAREIAQARRVAIKAGGGTRGHDAAVRRLAQAAGAAVVLSPGSTGVMPDAHAQNMHVGGSKGSISGNYAMNEAELLVVIGSRAVCQADCSGIGWKSAKSVINLNGNVADATHYNNTLALTGDITAVADRLVAQLAKTATTADKREWLAACAAKKAEWTAYKVARFAAGALNDEAWQRPVLPQPAAIKIVVDFAKAIGAAKFFDAGDVQANGFQIVEDDRSGDTFTEFRRLLHGLCGECAARLRARRSAALRHRVLRRRLLHDEPAGAHRRHRAWAARHDRDLRQPPHGGDHRLAGRAIRRGLPHRRSGRGRLRAARERGRGRQSIAWRLLGGRIEARACGGAGARRALGRARAGLLRAARARRARGVGAVECGQLVRGRAAGVDDAGSIRRGMHFVQAACLRRSRLRFVDILAVIPVRIFCQNCGTRSGRARASRSIVEMIAVIPNGFVLPIWLGHVGVGGAMRRMHRARCDAIAKHQ